MEATEWHSYIFNLIYSEDQAKELVPLLVTDGILLLFVALGAVLAYFVTRKLIYGAVEKIVIATPNDWDNELLKSKIFRWISLLVPVTIVWNTADSFVTTVLRSVLTISSQVTATIFVLCAFMSVLNIIERIYSRYEVSRKLPLKSFVQVIRILLVVVGIIFIVSSVIGQSPALIFSGLGAATAILMLIFKDSILGLVAGIQLSANKMVSVGDWIEMPKFGADGEVAEVALTTVKVINWDKTITTVPTYALISDSFKNWQGMSESGVRRIKRSLHFDIQSVHALSTDELARMRKISLLSDYLKEKEAEVAAWNKERNVTSEELVNARVLTNIGTFRAYVVEYLRCHPKIAQNQTILVRHLAPQDNGIPIEIYAFSTDNAWVNFEGIQSDIFDHLMAVTPEFGLRLFQRPSGLDLSGARFAE